MLSATTLNGASIYIETLRKPDQGEVRWDVVVTNREGEPVAAYDLLTMNAA
ncbi:MAG: hypothetical protein J0M07_25755 [Anaerolineae bacterium]|nr:hypothetical protein [Anaerolineae bacterium]